MTRQAMCLAAILAAGLPGAATAQTATPAPDPPAQHLSLKDRLKEPDQAGGLHFTEHFAIVFGGIKQGSGIALGPAFSTKFADGGFVQIKGVYSIRNFKLLQLRYDTRRFWDDRAIVISRVRWQDAPELKLYRLGPESPDRRTDYAERKTEVSSQIVAKLRPAVRAAGGFGVERYRTSADGLEQLADPESLALLLPPPGLGARPLFAHAVGSVGYDTRLSPDYTRGGRFFEAEVHGFRDLRGDESAFGRFEGTAEQYIPTHGGKGVIGLAARTWLSMSGDERSVPFYLMPTLGGGELLRAFQSYRFRDRQAMLLKAEYRWAVHEMLDVIGIYEAGKVAPTVSGLDFDDVAHSKAIGIRAHTKTAGLLRADIAHGREGFGFRIGFSAGGS